MEITTIKSFLEYYEKLRGRTLRVINCIPPDKMNWTHAEGKLTFADLIRHLAASERFTFAENVRGNKCAYPGHKKELAEDADALDFLNKMHIESMEILRSLTDEDLQKKCSTPAMCRLRPGNGCGRCANTKFITADRFTLISECLELLRRRFSV